MTELDKLVQELNKFDFTYVMSDDHNEWKKWSAKEKELKSQITLENRNSLMNHPELSDDARGYFNLEF